MTRFLFWNTKGKELIAPVADIARAQDADVLVLAESTAHPNALVRALNTRRVAYKTSTAAGVLSCSI